MALKLSSKFPQQLGHGFYSSYGYHSARQASRDGLTFSSGSSTYHMQYDRAKLIDQSRQFMRDNAIYKGMIERAISYIIGNGFALQARTKNKTFNSAAEQLWHDFWRKPEIKQLSSGNRIERMICRELLIAGDVGAIKTNQGQLQLVEAEQITGPKYSGDGIILDDYGKPVKFHIAPYTNSGRVSLTKAKSYNVDNFLFISDPERPSGVRSVPACQASFPMIHRINDICDSEAIAWQMLSRMAVSITREGGPNLGYTESSSDSDAEDTELAQRITEIDYALLFQGEPGDKIEGIDRNLPGKDFGESVRMFLRLLGLPIGLPLEIILLDWTKSNYSQSRAVLEQAYQTFIGWQKLIEDFFHNEVYIWKIKQWIATNKLANRSDAFRHEWIKPTFPWIDQLKEAQAYGAKMDRGFTTHAQVCKSLNVEREDIIDVREMEIREAIERAQKIKEDTGVIVPWQLFAGLQAEPSKTNGQNADKTKQDSDDEKKDNDNQDED